MYQIDKLEAVNRIMQPLNGTVVADLSQPLNDTVIQAIRALDTAADKVQFENEWNYHYAGPITLTADNDGEILIPGDWLELKFRSWSGGNIWNLTVKDNKVWNRKDSTTIVYGSVDIEGTRKFTYDESPAVIQNYIIEYAKLEFLGENARMSAPRLQLYASNKKDAYQAALKWDSQLRWGAMNVQQPIRDVLRTQGSNRGWWWGN